MVVVGNFARVLRPINELSVIYMIYLDSNLSNPEFKEITEKGGLNVRNVSILERRPHM